jgi:hypothetical protein
VTSCSPGRGKLELARRLLKIAGDIALIEGVVRVNGTAVARGKLGFALGVLNTKKP